MKRAQIVTWWVKVSGDDVWDLTESYPDIINAQDMSEQQPPVSAPLVVQGDMEDATLTAIKADPNYGEGAVLWEESI
jgi:hypothetical protein